MSIQQSNTLELPTWIDPEAWQAWVDARKKIKKPLTDRAAKRALALLEKMRAAGHDPNESLDQSADFYWQGLYPPKQQAIPALEGGEDKTLKKIKQEEAAYKPLTQEQIERNRRLLEEVKANIKRVA